MSGLKKLPFLALALCISFNAYAGGPINVDGTTPVRYSPATVTLNFDLGSLGALNNSTADSLALQAMSIWNGVATADITLKQGNDLPVDVNGSNFSTYIPDAANNNPSVNSDGLNPVVYDSDGSIIDALFGTNASNSIAGFAASSYIAGTGKYKEGFLVINGKSVIGGHTQTTADIITTITHELGHLIGLDHSQLDINSTSTGCTWTTPDNYPEMYPVLCRSSNTLHEDDISTLSYLYPASNVTTTFGQISGVFVDTNGNPILGANIYVKDATSGNTYSVVSDYLMQKTGYFSMYVLPGTYTLNADAINSMFYGPDSVGPYATTQSDLSFTSPNPISPVTYDGSTPGTPQTITVNAGENRYVKFVVDGSGQISITSKAMTVLSYPSSSSNGTISPFILLIAASGIFYLRRKRILA